MRARGGGLIAHCSAEANHERCTPYLYAFFPASLLVLHLQALLHKAGEGVSLYDWNYVASFVVVLAFHSAANLFNT